MTIKVPWGKVDINLIAVFRKHNNNNNQCLTQSFLPMINNDCSRVVNNDRTHDSNLNLTANAPPNSPILPMQKWNGTTRSRVRNLGVQTSLNQSKAHGPDRIATQLQIPPVSIAGPPAEYLYLTVRNVSRCSSRCSTNTKRMSINVRYTRETTAKQ